MRSRTTIYTIVRNNPDGTFSVIESLASRERADERKETHEQSFRDKQIPSFTFTVQCNPFYNE